MAKLFNYDKLKLWNVYLPDCEANKQKATPLCLYEFLHV